MPCFTKPSAFHVCFLGSLLAAIPLLPQTSHWECYGQSGICVPLPITRKSFKGRSYSFAVIIVLNFVLFLLIAAGQSVIYLSVKDNLMTTDTTKKSQDLVIARRLITVVVSNFVCWFPVSVMGLLVSAGVPITGEVNVAMAILVLPLNSALNPFLYTFNMVKEKRRKLRELKLLKLLESRVVGKAAPVESGGSRGALERDPFSFTIEDAVQFLGQSLVSKATTIEQVRTFLQAHSCEEKCLSSTERS